MADQTVVTRADDTAAASDDRLVVDGLDVRVGLVGLLHDVGFRLGAGERVGLIGESGSGKSLTALAIMGLLPDGLVASGHVGLAGTDGNLLDAADVRMADLRGRRMSMVFQEPMTALNPLMKAGDQVAEVLAIHGLGGSGRDRDRRALELLDAVRMHEPELVRRRYPHQLSGGQRQRVMLAIALANEPDVLICDEPTTALDVTVQAQMLDLVVEGARDRDASLLFITHDLAVVATVCDRVLVMYGGRIVEAGPVQQLFTAPRHPYTRGLVASSDLDAVDAAGRLPTIPGVVPAAGTFPAGCVFRTRCERATEACAEPPPWTGQYDDGHACIHPYGDEPVARDPEPRPDPRPDPHPEPGVSEVTS